jgi:diguanylate cyclase (GGDEF)-like protein
LAELSSRKPDAHRKAERDFIALGIAAAAIFLLVGNGSAVLPQIVLGWTGMGSGPDPYLANALILNVALVIFGWRRYSDLSREVSERRLAEEHAHTLARVDPLTGCHNRRSMSEAAETLFRAARDEQGGIAIFMMDLDNFKQINDVYGHHIGDQVLVAISGRVRALLPGSAIVARIGGDELAIILPLTTIDREAVDELGARMLSEAAKPITVNNMIVETTVSLGMDMLAAADIGPDAQVSEAVSRMLHHADMAMYQAKKQGRNRSFWFEPAMESELRIRNELELDMRKGVQNGEFIPYYEQQIDIASGRLVGFEMLARWLSPHHGLVSPDVFIPVAEESGLIIELSESLIRQALRDAREWDSSLTLSINISPVQLRDPWFAQRFLKLLVEAGFPADRIDLEITESGLHENMNQVVSTMISLKNQGVKVSLDDFGTGYSSLSQLSELPFDQIKIDRSFVGKLAGKTGDATIVESIVRLGQGLDLPLIAEGIESKEVLSALREYGEFRGQGYLYGRPEDAGTTRERLLRLGLMKAAGDILMEPEPEQDAGSRKTG